jgi:hypothetical protein
VETARAHAAETLLAEAVIAGALIGIGEDTIGFVDLLELLFGIRFPVHVGVVLAREAAKRGFDLIIVRVPSNSKDFVVIAVAHNLRE